MLCLTIDDRWETDFANPIELAIPLEFGGAQPSAFGLPRATAEPVVSLESGGPVNCVTVTLNPHGNGTHTECAGHVVDGVPPVYDAVPPEPMPACLITVVPEDGVVGRAGIETALRGVPPIFRRCVIVRTGERDAYVNYSGAAPAYVTEAAMRWVRGLGVEHLLLDLPSVDPENDGGEMAAHKIFWDAPEAPRRATITEMIRVPSNVADGLYVLALHIPRFCQDAAPSRPVIWAVRER
jgi:kynurenine formamidase